MKLYNTLLFIFFCCSNIITAQNVKIQYLANEGVLIKSGNEQILIDAIFTKEFDYLDVLPNSELERITTVKPPYQSIDLILATHIHGDHFNADLTGKHMLKNKKTQFIGPDEVANNFKQNYTDFKAIDKRIKSITPDLFKSETIKIGNVTIEVLRTEHFGNKPWNEAENLVFLIEIQGKKILHFGDGKIDKTNLDHFNLKDKNIDVAIIPYWQLGSMEQRSIIETYINPRQILVGHIPLKSNPAAQKNIDGLGYKNAIALIERNMEFILNK